MADYDAIAIGGGLAGAAFALTLARSGARVAIIERTTDPQLKVCGDFLSVEARRLLLHLDVDVDRLGARNINTVQLVNGTASADAPLPFTASGFTRFRLDEALLTAAQDAGAELIRGESATGLVPGRCATVRIGRRALNTKAVALATGKHNLRGWSRPKSGPTAYKMPFELTREAAVDLNGIARLHAYRGGYAGACLTETGAATLCWLADKAMIERIGADWSAHLADLATRSPRLGDLLSGARALAEKPATVSSIPFGHMRTTEIAETVFPVGDQIAVIPPYTGDGTSLALSSGLDAAQAVIEGRAAGAYQRSFLARIRTQFRFAGIAHYAFANRITRRIGLGAVALAPQLATLTAQLTRLRDVESILGPAAAPAYISSSTK